MRPLFPAASLLCPRQQLEAVLAVFRANHSPCLEHGPACQMLKPDLSACGLQPDSACPGAGDYMLDNDLQKGSVNEKKYTVLPPFLHCSPLCAVWPMLAEAAT